MEGKRQLKLTNNLVPRALSLALEVGRVPRHLQSQGEAPWLANEKNHAVPVISSTTPAINSITVLGLAVLGKRIEYAAEI